MLWLVIGDASHTIISCNTHQREGKHQIWVTRANGKNLMVHESDKEEPVREIKEAIDFAIEQNEKSLKLW